jgi:hypothetical protein
LKIQVDADTAVVGDQGEINFKEEAKFSQHLKEKAEAVSDFAKSKSLAQQRQYLPIFTVRDDLLQVCTWVCIYHELFSCVKISLLVSYFPLLQGI